MPFKSKAQMRKFYALEAKGELPEGTAHEWANETRNIKKLPERVKKRKKKKSMENELQFKRLYLAAFEKLAADKADRAKRTGLGLFGSVGASAGGMAALSALRPSIIKTTIGGGEPETARMAESFKKHYGLNTRINTMDPSDPLMKNIGPHYNPQLGEVNVPKGVNKGTLLHELGHAQDFKKYPNLKFIGSRQAAPIVGGIAGLSLLASKDPEKRKYAPYVSTAGTIPMLYQEGKATTTALRHVNRVQGKKEMFKTLRNILPAQLSYLAMPLMAGGGTYLGKKLIDRMERKKHREAAN